MTAPDPIRARVDAVRQHGKLRLVFYRELPTDDVEPPETRPLEGIYEGRRGERISLPIPPLSESA